MIYLIRHGQTEFNVTRRFQGGLDSPLTALGEAQAIAMGRRLRELTDPATTMLLASPRGRAQQTAALIAREAGLSGEIVTLDGLAEVSLGSWDGKTGPELDAQTGGGWSRLDARSWFFETPDGERYDSFAARLADAMETVARAPAPVKIVVSHGIASRVLRGQHLGLSQDALLGLTTPQGVIYRLDEGAITEIDCMETVG